MQSRKIIFQQTAVVLVGQIVCVGAMLGIYALLGYYSGKVFLSGLVGLVLATLNFFFMAVGATLAADKAQEDNVNGGKSLMQSSYMLRLAVLALVLFACAKSGFFDLLALVLPLAFTRPILTVGEFFRKSGDEKR